MVDTNIKHGTFVPKENHKHTYSFCLKESADPGGVRRLHKYNLWHFNLWPIKSDLNRFHQCMGCYASERHGAGIRGKLELKHCAKEDFDGK